MSVATDLKTVTDKLRHDILVGHFPPSSRLIEVELTDRYDCGRAGVRRALVALEAEGLIDTATNRGATVRRVSVTEVIQITQARAALEGLIAADAAAVASTEERAELEGLIAEMRLAVDRGDGNVYSNLNDRLHRRIREMSDHVVAADLVKNLRNRAAHHQYRLALVPGRPAESLEQHAAIVDAIVAGDTDRAEAAMKSHLSSVIEVLGRWGDVQV